VLKKIITVILLIGIVTSTAACGFLKKDNVDILDDTEEENDNIIEGMRNTVLYFTNDYGLLVPVTKQIPWVEGIGKAALEHLADSSLRDELEQKGLKPSLPENAKVLGMAIHDGIAKVDFSSDFLNNPDEISEKNALAAVVYTLTEFPSIDAVTFLVEGKPLRQCPNGNEIDETVQRESLSLNMAQGEYSKGDIPVTLYFKSRAPSADTSFFVPVTYMVPEPEDPIKMVLEHLIKGPPEDMGLAKVIPENVKVLETHRKGPEVIIDFSKEITDYGGGIEVEEAIVNSVVLSVSEFPGVEKVSLLVEGKTDILPEGSLSDMPISKPVFINTY